MIESPPPPVGTPVVTSFGRNPQPKSKVAAYLIPESEPVDCSTVAQAPEVKSPVASAAR